MDAADPLLQDSRVPGDIHVDDHGAALEVQADAARVGGEKHFAGRLLLEPFHQCSPVLGRNAPVEMDVADAVSPQHVFDQLGHSQPLAEDHCLFTPFDHEFLQQDLQLFDLRPVHGGVIDEVGVVRRHAHHGQRDLHPPLVRLAQEPVAPPLGNELRHDFPVLVVQRLLLRSQGDQEILVDARRKLFEDPVPFPPDHNAPKGMADLLQVPVADNLFRRVRDPVVVDETIERPQAMTVDELHQGVQLLGSVFDGGAGQDQGKGRFQLLDRFGGAGLPVLDTLCLIEDDQVRRPFPDQIQVSGHQFVVDQLVKGVAPVEFPLPLI